jgi:hypothetical protein
MECVRTVKETAIMLGVCENTVYNLLKSGKLQRVENRRSDRGRPLTLISGNSIISYVKEEDCRK